MAHFNIFSAFRALTLTCILIVGVSCSTTTSVPTPSIAEEKKVDINNNKVVNEKIIEEALQYMEEDSKYLIDRDYSRKIFYAKVSGEEVPFVQSGAKCLDRHSHLFNPQEAKEYLALLHGFMGIGIAIEELRQGGLIISNIMKGGPAYNKGMRFGDIIHGLREDRDKIFYPIKTLDDYEDYFETHDEPIFITVSRDGRLIEFDPMVEAVVMMPNVMYKKIDKKAGYVQIDIFGKDAGKEFEDALRSFKKLEDEPSVIVDLRNNPGGDLIEVLHMMNALSRNYNDIVLTKKTRHKTHRYISNPDLDNLDRHDLVQNPGEFSQYHFVILINRFSASASEIFAGVLKDWGSGDGRVVIVGEVSRKKGVGQSLYKLSDDWLFVLTTFEFFVGNSEQKINGIGVIPHHIVPDTVRYFDDLLTKRDAQFMFAIKLLQSKK